MSAWNDYFFTLLFCSVLVRAGAGSCNQLSTGPTMKFLSHLRASVSLYSRSMRPVGCYNSVGSRFFIPLLETVYAFHNLVVRRKKAAMTPSETVSVLQLFFLTATLPIIDLMSAFGIKRTVRVSNAGLSFSLWSACVNGKVKNYANGMHTIQWLLTRFSFFRIFLFLSLKWK